MFKMLELGERVKRLQAENSELRARVQQVEEALLDLAALVAEKKREADGE